MADQASSLSSSALRRSSMAGIGSDEESKAPSSASIPLNKIGGNDELGGEVLLERKGSQCVLAEASDGGKSISLNQQTPKMEALRTSCPRTSPSRKKDQVKPTRPSNHPINPLYPVNGLCPDKEVTLSDHLENRKLQPELTSRTPEVFNQTLLGNTHSTLGINRLSPPTTFENTSNLISNTCDQRDANHALPNRTSHASPKSPARSREVLEDDEHETGASKMGNQPPVALPSLSNVHDPGIKNITGKDVLGDWASVVKNRGDMTMKLAYIKPPISEGKIKIKPPSHVIQKGVEKWENTLVGFFLDKLPFSLVQNHAMKLWASKGLVEVLSNGNGFFFFRFSDGDNVRSILEGGPWYFGGRPIFLRKWQQGLNLTKNGCRKVPIWAHFYNVPMEYWTEEGLSYIASVVGRPLAADKMTESLKRISFARICVEIDVEDTLPDSFDLELEEGDCINIRIEYNWVPKKCVVCKEFGHLAKNCKRIKTSEWRPKVAPSRPESPQEGVKEQGQIKEVSTSISKGEDDWKVVKRNGKAIIIDTSPVVSPAANQLKNNDYCNVSNIFEVLGTDLDSGKDEMPLAIIPSTKIESLDGKEGEILPSRASLDLESSPHGFGVDKGSNAAGNETPNSDCYSVPLSNPLLEKLNMIDELDRKRQKNSKKKDKKRNAGVGGPSGKPSF